MSEVFVEVEIGHYYEIDVDWGETTMVEVLEWHADGGPAWGCWLVRVILSEAETMVMGLRFKAELNEMQVLALAAESPSDEG